MIHSCCRVTGAGSNLSDKSPKKPDNKPTGGDGRNTGVDESDLLASTSMMRQSNVANVPQLGNAFGSVGLALRSVRPGHRLHQLRDTVMARAPRMPWQNGE